MLTLAIVRLRPAEWGPLAAPVDNAVHSDVRLIVLRRRPQDPTILGKVALRECRHHASGAGGGDPEAHALTDRDGPADPRIFHEPRLPVAQPEDDVRPEPADLEAAFR